MKYGAQFENLKTKRKFKANATFIYSEVNQIAALFDQISWYKEHLQTDIVYQITSQRSEIDKMFVRVIHASPRMNDYSVTFQQCDNFDVIEFMNRKKR